MIRQASSSTDTPPLLSQGSSLGATCTTRKSRSQSNNLHNFAAVNGALTRASVLTCLIKVGHLCCCQLLACIPKICLCLPPSPLRIIINELVSECGKLMSVGVGCHCLQAEFEVWHTAFAYLAEQNPKLICVLLRRCVLRSKLVDQ